MVFIFSSLWPLGRIAQFGFPPTVQSPPSKPHSVIFKLYPEVLVSQIQSAIQPRGALQFGYSTLRSSQSPSSKLHRTVLYNVSGSSSHQPSPIRLGSSTLHTGVGLVDGIRLGITLGSAVGSIEGAVLGREDGLELGLELGCSECMVVGELLGTVLGKLEGAIQEAAQSFPLKNLFTPSTKIDLNPISWMSGICKNSKVPL